MKNQARLFGLLGAAALLSAGAALASPTPEDMTITVSPNTSGKTPVPATFAGIFDASNAGKRQTYDTNFNTQYAQYKSLISQMQVRHWRVEGAGIDTNNGNSPAQIDQIMTFIGATGAPAHSVMWGLWLYNDPNEGPYDPVMTTNSGDNTQNAAYIMANPTYYGTSGLLQAFAFGNEINYRDNIGNDTYVSGYYTNKLGDPWGYVGAQQYWETQRSWVTTTATDIGAALPAFMGCDTGDDGALGNDSWDLVKDTNDGTLGTTNLPWMVRFARDEGPNGNIIAATEHLYVGSGNSKDVPTFDGTTGLPYCAGDEVLDPTDNSHLYVAKSNFICGAAQPAPSADTTRWTCLEPAWSGTGSYNQGDVVRDTTDITTDFPDGVRFQCVSGTGVNSAGAPSGDVGSPTSIWVTASKSHYQFPGPHQLATQIVDQLGDWSTRYANVLAGAPHWPTVGSAPLPYRFTEFSPFAGPEYGAYTDGVTTDGHHNQFVIVKTAAHTDCFASALVGLEMFHYWARAGAQGVNPEEGTTQTNSPIIQSNYAQAQNPYIPNPYAYVWPAFNVSAYPGTGQELPDGTGISAAPITISGFTSPLNVSTYAVVTPKTGAPTDVYITVINKTFAYDDTVGQGGIKTGARPNGAYNVAPKIVLGSGTTFVPTTVQYTTLSSTTDPTAAGVSTSEGTAYLGSHTFDTNTTHTQFPTNIWTSAKNWTTGSSSYTLETTAGAKIYVPAFSAMIIHLKH